MGFLHLNFLHTWLGSGERARSVGSGDVRSANSRGHSDHTDVAGPGAGHRTDPRHAAADTDDQQRTATHQCPGTSTTTATTTAAASTADHCTE